MPKIRLFTEQPLISNAQIELSRENMHYLTKVMRRKIGDEFLAFNGKDGLWLCVIDDISKKSAAATTIKKIEEQTYAQDIWLCFAPVKNTPLTNIIQKATELGAAKLKPVITEYTSVNKINIQRAKSIIIESCEQCERLDLTEIDDSNSICKLEDMLDNWDEQRKIILCDESGGGEPILKTLQSLKNQTENFDKEKYAILIGPEGGFSKAEFEIIRSKSYIIPVSLGKRILRADTAAISALSCYMNFIETE